MKKIVRNEGEMIKVKKKGKILRGKHEGMGLTVLQNIQKADWKNSRIGLENLEKSGKMILGKKWLLCYGRNFLRNIRSTLPYFASASKLKCIEVAIILNDSAPVPIFDKLSVDENETPARKCIH